MSVTISMRRAMITCALLLSSACGDSTNKVAADPVKVDSPVNTTVGVYGGVESVDIATVGVGATREEAIRDGVLRAVEQVHGRAISMTTVRQELGSVEVIKQEPVGGISATTSVKVTAVAGGAQLAEATGGIVTSIKIVEEDESGNQWKVSLVASVAKYTPPSTRGPKVVVAMPRGAGGISVDEEVATALRERISAALGSTGGLTLLDRSMDPSIDEEIALAGSSASGAAEQLRQGQTQVADLVVQVTVTALEVDRQARMMRTTNREIVSYSGSASASYRVIQVATRQLVSSGNASASRDSDASLKDDVNPEAWKRGMIEEIAKQLTSQIAAALVPIRVVDRDGLGITVNAGRERLVDDVYDVVVLGDAIKDPETGASIGRRERFCCEFTVTRRDERLSSGTLDKDPGTAAGEALEVRARTPR